MGTAWLPVVAGVAAVCVVVGLLAWWAWRRCDQEDRTLVRRIARLRLRDKLRLALARDSRVPPAARLVPPGLILYLATPLDVIPDFIPVIGHLDDVLIVLVGVGVLLRFTPRRVVEEHVARLEGAAAAD